MTLRAEHTDWQPSERDLFTKAETARANHRRGQAESEELTREVES